jgi:hypothetical protein
VTPVANLQRWPRICFFKSANFWVQSAISNLQISEICESANFKSANFVGEPVCKFSAIRQRELNIFLKKFPLFIAKLYESWQQVCFAEFFI